VSSARYAYLGPEGTFTEAALRTLPEAATKELVPMRTVPAALAAVRRGEASAALVPIENSVEGGVAVTMDELAGGSPLVILSEVVLPISFALLVRPGVRIEDVKRVTGHPMAQGQVRHWLEKYLPDAYWEPAASNAAGARMVQEGQFDGAFAGEFAAPIYGLTPLVTGIHDAFEAVTRFVLVGRPGRLPAPTGSDRTSVVVRPTDDRPGALLEVLQEFSVRGVNLMRIESRPTGEQLGRYWFTIDAEGHLADPRVAEVLTGLRRRCPDVRVLGSYPQADRTAPGPVETLV